MGIVILNLLGQCGPFLGTNIFPNSDGPRYAKGQCICAAFMLFTTCLSLSLRSLLIQENRRLIEQYGALAEKAHLEQDEAIAAEENYGPNYRYTL
jgi:hypothetical protein